MWFFGNCPKIWVCFFLNEIFSFCSPSIHWQASPMNPIWYPFGLWEGLGGWISDEGLSGSFTILPLGFWPIGGPWPRVLLCSCQQFSASLSFFFSTLHCGIFVSGDMRVHAPLTNKKGALLLHQIEAFVIKSIVIMIFIPFHSYCIWKISWLAQPPRAKASRNKQASFFKPFATSHPHWLLGDSHDPNEEIPSSCA